jgi:hypothetical protein
MTLRNPSGLLQRPWAGLTSLRQVRRSADASAKAEGLRYKHRQVFRDTYEEERAVRSARMNGYDRRRRIDGYCLLSWSLK